MTDSPTSWRQPSPGCKRHKAFLANTIAPPSTFGSPSCQRPPDIPASWQFLNCSSASPGFYGAFLACVCALSWTFHVLSRYAYGIAGWAGLMLFCSSTGGSFQILVCLLRGFVFSY
ncbi:hypothetical protein NC652_034114 [Populus alba x Populus x berolinensis]|nr:hypothetical protein NC652_034114 [Populus alba x Populus x berolinensis]